jgi:predicted enzyme related to lactoylglutathione lyase
MAFTMYPVTDMPRAVTFYRDMLGLKETDVKAAFWQEFDIDGQTFGIGNFEQVGTPGSAQSLALEISDLPKFRAELIAKGLEVSEPHELQFCWLSVVKDPDGNQVWLHQAKPR